MDDDGREIEPINKQAIRVSTGRNGVLGRPSAAPPPRPRFKS